eukprot:1047519-Pyramimonas_sp.AAC.1
MALRRRILRLGSVGFPVRKLLRACRAPSRITSLCCRRTSGGERHDVSMLLQAARAYSRNRGC